MNGGEFTDITTLTFLICISIVAIVVIWLYRPSMKECLWMIIADNRSKRAKIIKARYEEMIERQAMDWQAKLETEQRLAADYREQNALLSAQLAALRAPEPRETQVLEEV